MTAVPGNGTPVTDAIGVADANADAVPAPRPSRVLDRCDRLAVDRCRALKREQKGGDERKSLAEEVVEELEAELATLGGRSAPQAKRASPSRAEVLAAEWWRGDDALAARLDAAGLDDAERDALGLLIGLECGPQVSAAGVHDSEDSDDDLQAPLKLMRLVELGRAGPLTRGQLAPSGRLATSGLMTSCWRSGGRRTAPYLALRPHPRFLVGLGDLKDAFGWPKPWVRLERPRESFDDLIVEPSLQADLREVLDLARHALKGRRGASLEYGRGLCVLLHGPAGTGKTLAARATAHALDVPLACYDRVRASELGLDDGHLARLLEGWRPKDGLLFIDEVDDQLELLRRGDNNELLIGLEAFEGVLVFATNRALEVRESLDRRIQRVVPFPYPDAACRERLIRAHLPAGAMVPDDALPGLARHVVSGGLIKNAALEAAALAEERAVPLDAALLDLALARQNRAATNNGGHDALLARLRTQEAEGFDAAVAVLRHALDPEGARARARLGLLEPVIDVVAPAGVAMGIVDAIASALEFTVRPLQERRERGDKQGGDYTFTDVSRGPAALVADEHEDDFAEPRLAAARARKEQAFAAIRIADHNAHTGGDEADVTIRVPAAAKLEVARALIEARAAAAGLTLAPGALAALEAACVTPRDADVSLALRMLGAALALGHREVTAAFVEAERAKRASARPRGLFE